MAPLLLPSTYAGSVPSAASSRCASSAKFWIVVS